MNLWKKYIFFSSIYVFPSLIYVFRRGKYIFLREKHINGGGKYAFLPVIYVMEVSVWVAFGLGCRQIYSSATKEQIESVRGGHGKPCPYGP